MRTVRNQGLNFIYLFFLQKITVISQTGIVKKHLMPYQKEKSELTTYKTELYIISSFVRQPCETCSTCGIDPVRNTATH